MTGLFSHKVKVAKFLVAFTSIAFCSFPAFSAEFSFIEFNIAFVLGLSLPILIISGLMKPLVSVQWRYPVLISVSLLGMLYALAYLEALQPLILLSCATLFLLLIYLWPLNIEADANSATMLNKISTYGGGLSGIVYVGAIWITPSVDTYFTWLIFGGAILLLSAVRITYFLKTATVHFLRLAVQWLLVLSFVVSMYLWLNNQANLNVLLITLVATYLITIVNGSWLLVNMVMAKLSLGNSSTNIALDDVFLYSHDPVTNLPSYQHALSRFERVLKNNPKRQFAAIVFKPTNFQQVNTVLGHHNSDILLLQFAYCLQRHVMENDGLVNFESKPQPVRLARLQSLNFLLVLDTTDSRHPEKIVIENLCQQLAGAVPDAMSFKSFSLHFELAFGVAFSKEHGNSVEELIACAGDALLEAEKHNDMLAYYDHQHTIYAEQQLSQMERLKVDIRDDNIRWYFQPQVQIKDRSFIGFELKAHWYNGATQPVELENFVDVAEHSGDIYLLTKLMIEHAFVAISTLQSQEVFTPVAVNIVSKQALESDLVEFIEQQIQQHQLSGKYLLIEIAEDVLLSCSQRAKQVIAQLKALEVNIGIDAFSGSYEALRYIRKMAIDQVKIDCQQLRNKNNQTDKAIINALINLTRSMQLPLIGVGIDSEEVKHTFNAIGGEIVQGNIINRGVVIDEFEVWLKRWLAEKPQD